MTQKCASAATWKIDGLTSGTDIKRLYYSTHYYSYQTQKNTASKCLIALPDIW